LFSDLFTFIFDITIFSWFHSFLASWDEMCLYPIIAVPLPECMYLWFVYFYAGFETIILCVSVLISGGFLVHPLSIITDNYDEFSRLFHSIVFPELFVPDGHPPAFRKVISVSFFSLFFELLGVFSSAMGINNSALFFI
jgi:hypothetical protein